MGPYCNFCNTRCFVHIPADLPEEMLAKYKTNTITATCREGQAFEKERMGICYADVKAWRAQQSKEHANG